MALAPVEKFVNWEFDNFREEHKTGRDWKVKLVNDLECTVSLRKIDGECMSLTLMALYDNSGYTYNVGAEMAVLNTMKKPVAESICKSCVVNSDCRVLNIEAQLKNHFHVTFRVWASIVEPKNNSELSVKKKKSNK